MMKIRKYLWLLCIGIMALASCASKPKPVVDAPPAVIEEVNPNAERKLELTKLHEEVLRLRVKAVELNAKRYFASRFEAADNEYIQGKTALDNNQLDEAQTSLQQAKPLFESLIADTYLAAIADEKEISSRLKKEAANAAVQKDSNEILLLAADAENSAMQAEDNDNPEATLALWIKTRMLYDAAIKNSKALAARARIEELDYSKADTGNFQTAENKLALANTLWATELKNAVDAVEEALLRYNLVLAKGWELLAGSRRTQAEVNKQKADEIKAAVAVANQYQKAKTVWESAIAASAKGENEYAADLFGQSEELFEAAWLSASEKRAAAEAAMAAALESHNRSLQVAEDGDEQLGIVIEADTETVPETDSSTEQGE